MAVSLRGASHDVASAVVLYAPAIRRYFTKRLPSRCADVDDLTQEVFARFLSAENAPSRERACSYLFGIARHVLADFLSAHRQSTVSLDDVNENELNLHRLQSRGDDPQEVALVSMQLNALLSKLPELQRKVLLAHELDGFSYLEVARLFGVSDQTVEKYLFLAKSYLRTVPH